MKKVFQLTYFFVPFLLLTCACLPVIAQDKQAIIDLDFNEEEDKKYITATVREYAGDSTGAPVEDLDVYFFVERTFNPLPIGDFFNMTDEEGRVTIEFPADLPGDTLGNVNILVQIKESDEYRDTSIQKTIQWGIPLEFDKKKEQRSLWASGANAPISLLILVNGLIAITWGIIIYILVKFYHISKL